MRGWLWAVALIVTAAQPAAGEDLKPGWIADKHTGCFVWNPYPQPNESITWSGRCPMGLATGSGVLQWIEDGKPDYRVEGEFREGKTNGHAVVVWPNGQRFEGEFVNGRRTHGVHTWPGKGRYEGDFVGPDLIGHGVRTWPNGASYDGEWRDNKPNGAGIYRSAGGQIYKGVWINGCFKDGSRWAFVYTDAASCGFPAADKAVGDPYLNMLRDRVVKYLPKQDENSAKLTVTYVVGLYRDGRLASIQIKKHSGNDRIDMVGEWAIRKALLMPPMLPVPDDFPGDPVVYITAQFSVPSF